jgi:lambda family phage tail tape measure protein
MADLKAQLEITADASGVEAGVGRAKKSLADLGATAQTAGSQASAGLGGIGAGADGAAKRVDAATTKMVGAIQRQIAQMEAGARTGSKYYEVLANQRGIPVAALKPYLDQLDAVAAKQGVAGAIAGRAGIQFNEFGLSAKQTSAALRQVPSQLTDIFVSLQGGQAPLTVLLQQGGQLKDIFGGIAPAAKALGSALLGLINPLTIAAAVVAALAIAYKQGSSEADEFARAIVLSGNAAGTTVGQLQSMAQSISAIAGTQGAAAETLALFAANGNIANASLERFSLAAIRLQRVGGQAVAETVKQFADLGKDPVAASIKLNETTRFLTVSLYQQIKALEDVGRTAEAAKVAQEGYATALESRTGELEERLGHIERAWRGIADAAKRAWDEMLNVGRPNTLQQQLAAAQSQLESLSGPNLGPEFGGSSEGANTRAQAALREHIALLSQSIDAENKSAAAQKASNDQVAAAIQYDKDGAQFLSNKRREEQEIAKARNVGAAAGKSQAEIEERIGQIREKYRDKSKTKNPQIAIDKSQLNLDIQSIRAASEELVAAYANSEKVLEALRAAGVVSEREYYEAKRGFINLESAARQGALQQEIERLQQEKLTGKEAIDNRRKIAEAESKLALARASSGSQLTVLSIQQEAALRRLELAYLSARQAAQDYFDQTERQQARELAGIGQGRQRRDFDSGISRIEDRFADQRRELENQRAQLELEGKFTDDARKQYEERLGIIREFQSKSIASFTTYYAEIIAKQGDFANGAMEALADYISGVADIAKQTEDVFSKAFGNLEDAFTEFFATGKLNFKEFGEALVRDLQRIFVRQNITGPLAQATQDGFGGLQNILGPLLGRGVNAPSVGQIDVAGEAAKVANTAAATAAVAAQTAALTASTASVSALTASTSASTAATTADTAATTASTAASTAAAAAIAAASASSSAALFSLTAAAQSAAVALSAVGASSSFDLFGDLLANGGSAGAGGQGFGGDLFGFPMSRGTNYVPFDNFPARLHRGEAVVPAQYNPAAGGAATQVAPVFNLKFENAPQVESNQRRRNNTGGEDVLVRFVKETARSAISEDMANNSGTATAFGRRFAVNPALGTMR